MSRVDTKTTTRLETQAHDYPYYRAALTHHRLPAAFIDLDHFATNLEQLRLRAGNLPIRLVTKSVRSVEVIRRILSAGPFMQGLLCYSVGEAAWLASEGFDDIVVAYPSVEPTEIRAAATQIRNGRSITLMVDSVEQVITISQIALKEDVVIPLAIDLDMSSAFPGIYFGVHRSPVHDVPTALAVAREIAGRRSVVLEGLMGYEGQIAGLMDDVPGEAIKSAVIRYLKSKSIREINTRRQAVVAALKKDGHVLRFVNGGGTGSFESTREDASVTELAAGSGLYAPTLFDHYRAFKVLPAAGFALPITRVPKAGVVTCSGGGYIASGPIGKNRVPLPWLPAGCSLIDDESAGEVQTPVRHSLATAPLIGEPILFRHAKAGELCERFNELLLIQDGKVIDQVRTYRGERKCFF